MSYRSAAAGFDITKDNNRQQPLLPAIQKMHKKIPVNMPIRPIMGIQQFLLRLRQHRALELNILCPLLRRGLPLRRVLFAADVDDEGVADYGHVDVGGVVLGNSGDGLEAGVDGRGAAGELADC